MYYFFLFNLFLKYLPSKDEKRPLAVAQNCTEAARLGLHTCNEMKWQIWYVCLVHDFEIIWASPCILQCILIKALVAAYILQVFQAGFLALCPLYCFWLDTISHQPDNDEVVPWDVILCKLVIYHRPNLYHKCKHRWRVELSLNGQHKQVHIQSWRKHGSKKIQRTQSSPFLVQCNFILKMSLRCNVNESVGNEGFSLLHLLVLLAHVNSSRRSVNFDLYRLACNTSKWRALYNMHYVNISVPMKPLQKARQYFVYIYHQFSIWTYDVAIY